MSDYKRGTRDGVRWAITWLHGRAEKMNDPHAKTVLNTAAFNLGVASKRSEILPRAGLAEDMPADALDAFMAVEVHHGSEGEK